MFGESRTRTTTTPISTLYVSASAVTTASPSGIVSSSAIASEVFSDDVGTSFSSSASSRSDGPVPTSTDQMTTPPDGITTTASSNIQTNKDNASSSQPAETPLSYNGVTDTESASRNISGRYSTSSSFPVETTNFKPSESATFASTSASTGSSPSADKTNYQLSTATMSSAASEFTSLSISGNTISSKPATRTTSPYDESSSTSAAICPSSDGRNLRNYEGTSYTIQCDTTYSGQVISTNAKAKRATYDFYSCTALCDRTAGCKAINIRPEGQCILYSSIQSSRYSAGTTGAYKRDAYASVDGSQTTSLDSSSVQRPSVFATSGSSTALASSSPTSVPTSNLQSLPSTSPALVITVFVTPSTCQPPSTIFVHTSTTYKTQTRTIFVSADQMHQQTFASNTTMNADRGSQR